MSKGQPQIRDVSKSYVVDGRPRLDVLQHAGFGVAPGAFVSIVGPGGCGKSTLLRLIAGLDRDYTGDILVHGERIAGASLSRGIVLQDHRLLPWPTRASTRRPSPGSKRAREVQHAEIYNLLGYSQRQLRRFGDAARSYREAPHFDGSYRPALQYQGELFIATGDIEGTRRNLGYLRILCGAQGCEEIDKLSAALVKAGHAP